MLDYGYSNFIYQFNKETNCYEYTLVHKPVLFTEILLAKIIRDNSLEDKLTKELYKQKTKEAQQHLIKLGFKLNNGEFTMDDDQIII